MDRVKLGVVGLGLMGDRFSRIISESTRAELTAVADVAGDRVTEVSGAWGGRGYARVDEMLERNLVWMVL